MRLFLGKIATLTLVAISLFQLEVRAERPRLVVNIVVGSMRADELSRYAEHLTEGGFKRLQRGGISYTEASYDYQLTLTPTSLATISTGTMPTSHGVIGSNWYDYVTNRRINLIEDSKVNGLEYYTGGGQFSPHRLVAPTVSESLMEYSPKSRVVTIALDPESSVVFGGKAGMTFWMNSLLCHWRSSSYYMPILPDWVKQYNKAKSPLNFILQPWSTLFEEGAYKNQRRSDILIQGQEKRGGQSSRKSTPSTIREIECDVVYNSEFDRLCYTPAGNNALFDFAKLAISQLSLGGDEHPDLLNLYLDTPRMICEAYGPESIELEDMYYRLDRTIEDFITFLTAQVEGGNIAIILTSDHGSSSSFDIAAQPRDRFNVEQFTMILESFLDARYGGSPQNWVLDYENKMIYLNHNLIYEKQLSVADIQNEVATFAMQFRGVSHALSATAMRTSYFGSGYAQKMQNSFYPRRSGDVILNLMPGWIEKQDRMRSMAGSMYSYDRRVPLIIYLNGGEQREVKRPVDMSAVAATTAELLGIPAPAAAETRHLEEISF